MLHLNYTIETKGLSCLVFIHGFLGNNNQWDRIVPEFLNHTIVKIELPGHGNTPDSKQQYSINQLADQVIKIIDASHLNQIHLIGHSMGGYVAAQVASKVSSRINSLILINSIAGSDSDERKESRNRSLKLVQRFQKAFTSMAIGNLFTAQERIDHKEKIKVMKRQATAMTITAVSQAIIAMRDRESAIKKLGKVSSIHYIYSGTDEIVPENRVVLEVKLLNAQKHQIESGHMSILTHPDQIVSIVNSILEDL